MGSREATRFIIPRWIFATAGPVYPETKRYRGLQNLREGPRIPVAVDQAGARFFQQTESARQTASVVK
jgi:hypothetical protein